MYIYQVADDREGLNEILATYNNEEAAEAHRAALEATDDEYGSYFTVTRHTVVSAPSDAQSTFGGLEDDD